MSRVKPDEIADRQNWRLTDAQKSALQEIIDEVEADLATYLRRSLTVEDHVENLTANDVRRDRTLLLEHTPVVTVTSVLLDGTALVVDDEYAVEPWGLARLSVWPTSMLVAASPLVVTYTAGLDPASTPGVTSKIKQVAARTFARDVLDDSIGVKNKSVEGASTSYEGAGWSDAELRSLKRYKRRLAG